MKIALIYYFVKGPFHLHCHVPISLLYLGTPLAEKGHEVAIFDNRVYSSEKEFFQKLVEHNPDLIGISLFADTYTIVYQLINKIRRFFDAKIILGGPEATVNRVKILEIFSKADYVIAGEAEEALLQLVTCIEEHDEYGLKGINGLSYRDAEKINHNPEAKPIKSIDKIPIPNRDLLEAYSYNSYYHPILKRPTDSVITSRGCTARCRFCFRLTKGYRVRSPENVLEEIEVIQKRGHKGLNIMDDNFTADRDRCLKIIEGILNKGWKFAMTLHSRAGKVDFEMLKLMKKAGVRYINIGIESGSQKILDAMNKKTSVDLNFQTIQLVKKAGIQCHVNFIVGFPGETIETINETLDFLKKAKPTSINSSVLYPLHGTPVYEEAKCDNTLVGEWGVLEDYPWVKLPWFKDISELKQIWKDLSKSYWWNSGGIFRAFKANIAFLGINDYMAVGKGMWYRYIKH